MADTKKTVTKGSTGTETGNKNQTGTLTSKANVTGGGVGNVSLPASKGEKRGSSSRNKFASKATPKR